MLDPLLNFLTKHSKRRNSTKVNHFHRHDFTVYRMPTLVMWYMVDYHRTNTSNKYLLKVNKNTKIIHFLSCWEYLEVGENFISSSCVIIKKSLLLRLDFPK